MQDDGTWATVTKSGCPLNEVTPFGAYVLELYGHYQNHILLRAANEDGVPVALGGQPYWYIQSMREVADALHEAREKVTKDAERKAKHAEGQSKRKRR